MKDSDRASEIEHPLERWLLAFSAILPLVVAVWNSENIADASHDSGVVRTVGLGFTGLFRALDGVASSLFMLVPIGTLAFRAAIVQSAAVGAIGILIFREVRRSLRVVEGPVLLKAGVAIIAALMVGWSVPIQIEARSAGGSVFGLLLPLLVREALLARAPIGAVGFLFGLCASYEPMSLVLAIGLTSIEWIFSPPPEKSAISALSLGFLLGLTPFGLALLFNRLHAEASLPASLFAFPLGEPGLMKSQTLSAFATTTFGAFICVVASVFALATLHPFARFALRWAMVGALSVGGLLLHAPCGPSRYSVAALGLVAAISVGAAIAFFFVVREVSRARIPFAFVSSLLCLLFGVSVPARLLDDTLTRSNAHTRILAGAWDEATWGSAPSRAVFLATDARWFLRALAARIAGDLRGDIEIVPLFDLTHRLAAVELYREPLLASMYRDIALGARPEEWSLAKLSSVRGTLLPFPPDWDQGIVRHMIPNGLFVQFEAEPRGMSDRKKALESFSSLREVLVEANVRGDPELAALTVRAFRSRIALQAESGERELLSKTIEDLRAVAPEDPLIDKIARRMVTTKGAMHVTDLLDKSEPASGPPLGK